MQNLANPLMDTHTENTAEHSLTIVEENYLLIANTHALQEKIESMITDKNPPHANLSVPTINADLSDELELVLTHLHRTQEVLEATMLSKHQLGEQRDRLMLRIQNLLTRLPGQWEAEAFDIKTVKSSNETAMQWDLKNAYVGDSYYHRLTFETRLTGEQVSINFTEISQPPETQSISGSSDVTSRPMFPITISPIVGTAYEGANAIISKLNTSNWILIVDLVKKLIEFCSCKPVDAPKLIGRPAFLNGLRSVDKSLSTWAPIFRYDKCYVTEELSRPYYSGLIITFENISQSHRKWSDLKFRFATIDATDAEFGTNPRFEFPEDGASHVFSSWYAEKDDNEGKRLELRFASPNIMDRQVWRSLSEEDQILVAGILTRLPNILGEHIEDFTTSKYSRAQWIELTQRVKTNFTNNVVA